MGGLDSAAAAAPVTTTARLVADAYMAAPADVAAAPATAIGPVSYVVWTCFVPLLWICLNLICMNLYELERNKTLFVCVYQMSVMLIRIHGIIIMIYMIFWEYHIRNNQTKKIGSGTFAVCKNHGTRQRFELCRVPRLQGTRQRSGHIIVPGWLLYFAVGREWHSANYI